MSPQNLKLLAVGAFAAILACVSLISNNKIAAENIRCIPDNPDIYGEITGYKTWKQVHKPKETGPVLMALAVISPADVAT